MADVRDLYQQEILDHCKKPRNFRHIEQADRQADAYNPLCGDKLSVYLRIEDGRVKDAAFHGAGCAISIASASMMTEYLTGMTVEEADSVIRRFKILLTGRSGSQPDAGSLGNLEIFSGVRGYPVRVKCALLAWDAMHAALNERR
jgi:nitrogen fixation NifU-like protein